MGEVLFKLVLLQITFGEVLVVGQVLPVFQTVICIPLEAGVAEAVTHGKLPATKNIYISRCVAGNLCKNSFMIKNAVNGTGG